MLKIDDLKFFVCPLSWITQKSWRVLELVNETTDYETGKIVHLPYPGAYLDQPEWYRQAVKVKRAERLRPWCTELIREKMKENRE